MKRLALLAFLAVTSTASGAQQQEYRLLPGLSAIAQYMLDIGVKFPDENIAPGSIPLDIQSPKAMPRVGFNG